MMAGHNERRDLFHHEAAFLQRRSEVQIGTVSNATKHVAFYTGKAGNVLDRLVEVTSAGVTRY